MNYLGKPVPLVKHSKNAVTKPNFSRTLGMLKSEEPAGPSFSWLHVRSNTVRISWPRVTGQELGRGTHSGRLCRSTPQPRHQRYFI